MQELVATRDIPTERSQTPNPRQSLFLAIVNESVTLGRKNSAEVIDADLLLSAFAKAIAETNSSKIKVNKKNDLIEIFMIKSF